jgi:hypothetical protein
MKSSRIVGSALCLALAALLSPNPAHGQYESGQWQVAPVFGVNVYDSGTPFKTAGMIGGTVLYNFNSIFSAGFGFGYSRPEVDGTYFSNTIWKISADTVFSNVTGYQASQWTYYGLLQAGIPLGNLYLYAQGGVGGVTFWADRQSFSDIEQITGRVNTGSLMIPLGVGFSYTVSSLIGIRIDAVDEIYTSFDRDQLNPVAEARFQNTCEVENFCIIAANGNPPETKSAYHNFRFSLYFDFTPGR